MKNRVLTALMLALSLSVAVFASPDMQRVENTNEEVFQLSEDVKIEKDTNLVPILWESVPETTAKTARLYSADEADIEAAFIQPTGLFTNEKTVTAKVFLNLDNKGIYDAKTKLALSVVDDNDTVIARQTSCEVCYDKEYYGLCLLYELGLVTGKSIEAEKAYYFKLDYTGAYKFENLGDSSSWYPKSSGDFVALLWCKGF